MNSSPFGDLLHQAVHEPGIISQAYRQFHSYSVGNQLLAWSQCAERGIQAGPINTYPGWKALGRWVRKGEKAITLCMPITVKKQPRNHVVDQPDDAQSMTWFVFKPRWFVLSQTEGQELPEAQIPAWDKTTALVYRLRVLGQWFDGIRFYAAASSPRRSRRTWAGLR